MLLLNPLEYEAIILIRIAKLFVGPVTATFHTNLPTLKADRLLERIVTMKIFIEEPARSTTPRLPTEQNA